MQIKIVENPLTSENPLLCDQREKICSAVGLGQPFPATFPSKVVRPTVAILKILQYLCVHVLKEVF